jgi:2'-5' RNA ligase
VPVAVIARLDDETAGTTVEKFADGLPDQHDARPPLHITLATYGDDADVQALDVAVDQVIRSWTPLPVTLVGFGIFPGRPSDVWLAPVPIHRLLQLHTELDAAVFEATAKHCDEFGIWTPTVVYDGPIDVTLDRIEIVRTMPFEIISSRMLPG